MRTELPIISFISFVLVLLPLPAHWRARNVATLTAIVWLAALNLIQGVNSIVWADTVVVKIPIWCDITTKLQFGAPFAFSAATLCIGRHLESVASGRSGLTSYDDRRRRIIFESVLCIGTPMFFMALHYIVQGHRFDIFEDIGCLPTYYWSWPALIIIYIPPFVMSCITAVYGALALKWFMKRRAQFSTFLASANAGLNASRYFRLLGLALVEMIWTTGASLFVLIYNIRFSPLQPYVSWAYVHDDWMHVNQIPQVLLPESVWSTFLFIWWMIPVSSFILFIFFGFGEDTKAEYRTAYQWVFRRIFREKPRARPILPTSSSVKKSHISLPSTMMTTSTGDIESNWDEYDLSPYTAKTPTSAGAVSCSTDHKSPTLSIEFQLSPPPTSVPATPTLPTFPVTPTDDDAFPRTPMSTEHDLEAQFDLELHDEHGRKYDIETGIPTAI